MILNWLVGPVLGFLNGLFSHLPTGGWGGADTVAGNGAWNAAYLAHNVSSWMHQASYFLPVQLIVTLMYVTFFALLPAILIYSVAQWGYRELPDIAGFGPS